MDSNMNEYAKLFKFSNDKERVEFLTDRIQLDILAQITNIMRKQGISRSDLAVKLKVSKSYVSQLFSCDKRLNLKTLAQLEHILDAKLNCAMSEKRVEFEQVPDFQ